MQPVLGNTALYMKTEAGKKHQTVQKLFSKGKKANKVNKLK